MQTTTTKTHKTATETQNNHKYKTAPKRCKTTRDTEQRDMQNNYKETQNNFK